MWCYRIERHVSHNGLTLPLADTQRQAPRQVGGEMAFSMAMNLTFELFKHIGWDGTRKGEVRCFTVPGLYSMMVGFIITDAQGHTFIASPIPLAHMEKGLDWDAHVSHEEIVATKRALLTGHIQNAKPEPKVGIGGWRISGRGNMWATINGLNVTIVPAGEGYCGLIRKPVGPAQETTLRTPIKQTQQEVQKYVLSNWYDILDPRDIDAAPVTDDETEWW